jgi:hypothetical protein
MLQPNRLQSLPEFPSPLLTVYVNTAPAKASSREPVTSGLARLQSQIILVARMVSQEEQPLFQEQAERVIGYLRGHPLEQRGLAMFAGPNVWEVIPLQLDIEDEVHWGIPAMAQLFWLLDENRSYGAVVVDRQRARFFLYRLGEFSETEGKEFRLEPSRKKDMGPVARPDGVRMSRGIDRDTFEHHLEAQYGHFLREIAEKVKVWQAAESLDSVLLIGASETARSIQNELSQALSEKVVLIEQNLGWMSRAELQERIAPILTDHERERESRLVENLLSGQQGVTIGIDETLTELQHGKIRSLAVAKGFSCDLHQCVRCGWLDRTADSVCPACGGERQSVTLRESLPGLVRHHQAAVEVVSGEAARMLQGIGGMGGWLCEFEKKEYRAAPSHG